MSVNGTKQTCGSSAVCSGAQSGLSTISRLIRRGAGMAIQDFQPLRAARGCLQAHVTRIQRRSELLQRSSEIEQARKALGASITSGSLTVALDDALHYLAARPQHSFDIVASGYVLHNLTANYRERLYDEIWRVLAHAGLLINADKYSQQGEAHREALNWQLGLFWDVLGSRGQYDLLREWVLHYAEDEAADRVMPEADAITRLELLGFANVKIVYRKYMDAVLVARKP